MNEPQSYTRGLLAQLSRENGRCPGYFSSLKRAKNKFEWLMSFDKDPRVSLSKAKERIEELLSIAEEIYYREDDILYRILCKEGLYRSDKNHKCIVTNIFASALFIARENPIDARITFIEKLEKIEKAYKEYC